MMKPTRCRPGIREEGKSDMKHRQLLAAVSAVQLGLGLLALPVALRDRIPADLRLIRISPDRIQKQQWVIGTGL